MTNDRMRFDRVPDGPLAQARVQDARRGIDLTLQFEGRAARDELIVNVSGRMNGQRIQTAFGVRGRNYATLSHRLSAGRSSTLRWQATGQTNATPYEMNDEVTIRDIDLKGGRLRFDLASGATGTASLSKSEEGGGSDGGGGGGGGSGGGGGGFWGGIIGGVLITLGILTGYGALVMGGTILVVTFATTLSSGGGGSGDGGGEGGVEEGHEGRGPGPVGDCIRPPLPFP